MDWAVSKRNSLIDLNGIFLWNGGLIVVNFEKMILV